MNIEDFRIYCLSLPLATEDMAFGEEHLLLRVGGKIFACIDLERPDYIVLKCDPDYAIDLRDRFADIQPAWHWNKKYWNQLSIKGTLSDSLICDLIYHSYTEVVKKLPKKIQSQLLSISTTVKP